mmetsp:Transcript_13777/g.41106  ORF Transcript_13777/g.41106 Transcript_13777/m.41106 type:complete len:161 (-) Transcript_13777:65-547(-)
MLSVVRVRLAPPGQRLPTMRASRCLDRPVVFAAAILLLMNTAARCHAAGAVGAAMPGKVDAEIQALIKPFQEITQRRAAEARSNDTFQRWEAVEVKKQVVAGTNYFVKVAISDKRCVHLRIFQPLPHTQQPAKLVAVKLDQDIQDSVAYFEAANGDLGEL